MMRKKASPGRGVSILSVSLAFIMAAAAMLPLISQDAYAAFSGKKGSKYTVWDGGQITYGSGSGGDRKSTRLNSSHPTTSRMPSSA